MEEKIEKLMTLRPFILWMELAGLLHDIGKLSREFIEYRIKWQDGKDGWNWENDPHVTFLRDKKDLIKKSHPDLNKLLSITLGNLFPDLTQDEEITKELSYFENYNLYDIVSEHVSPKSSVANLLKTSDAKDTAIDRNNPLTSGEQKDIDSIYIATVFGHEERLNLETIDEERTNLFNFLNYTLEGYLTGEKKFSWEARQKILDAFKKFLVKGLTDTTRPVNDILLWEHSYATATILKVLLAHFVLTGELLDGFNKVQFSIVGFGWDGMAYYSQGEKMADISAKKQKVEDLKEAIRKIVEYDIPAGNMIYHDDDGIYFLLPPKKNEGERIYQLFLEEVIKRVAEISAKITDGEIQPIVKTEENIKFVTAIVKVINEIRKEAAFPYRATTEPLTLNWFKKWDNMGHTICPICRKRPVAKGNGNICNECLQRRIDAQKIKRGEDETLFIDDIADQYDNVCLILCNFELAEWLNGNMIRTLMVKEPHLLAEEIKRLGEIRGFNQDHIRAEKKVKMEILKYLKDRGITNSLENYVEHINWKNDLELVKNWNPGTRNKDCEDYVKAIIPLYDRRHILITDLAKIEEIKNSWTVIKNEAVEEHNPKIDIESVLLTKTPTPSRILRVWNETEQFFTSHVIKEIKESVGKKKRIKIDLDKPGVLKPLVIYDDVEVLQTGETISLIEEDDGAFVIGKEYHPNLCRQWHGSELSIPPTEFDEKREYKTAKIMGVSPAREFYPFRVITCSPNLFMALVPAEKAFELSHQIYKKYKERMGKVMGRLPFSIANIFFPKKVPMFAVLDTARRMRRNFRKVSENYKCFNVDENDSYKLSLEGNDSEIITIEKVNKLGDGSDDYFYPYFFIKDVKGGNGAFQLDTPKGPIVHIDDIKKKDRKLKVWMGSYDFELLNQSTKRLFVSRLSGDKRYHLLLKENGPRPYLLQQMDQLLLSVWEVLKKRKVTDSQVMRFESLLTQKFFEWQVHRKDDGKIKQVWESLIDSAINVHFQDLEKDEHELLLSATKKGAFFDCLELFMKIMKERLEELREI